MRIRRTCIYQVIGFITQFPSLSATPRLLICVFFRCLPVALVHELPTAGLAARNVQQAQRSHVRTIYMYSYIIFVFVLRRMGKNKA